ncbi:hypothetical protein ACL7TT_01450 [Microbulbifer sp. 2304DJ12-6]|uniref:phage tail tip fiber protein n=1 Tax=Microbulbifer sp. 2304DJ12-6 TaxID=3233340 RepID=UPI0039AF9BA4
MARRTSGLPNVSPKVDRALRPLLEKMVEVIEVGEGVRGDPLDAYLTIRSLIDTGLAKLINNTRFPVPGRDLVATTPAPNPIVPPAPTGFTVSNGFSHVFLQWDNPNSQYQGHAFTTIYRATEDNLANAVAIGQSTSFLYADVGVQREVTYYYWITYTSATDIEGPRNAAAGTAGHTAPDPALVLKSLSGQIRETQLYQALQDRIDLIDSPATGLVDSLGNEISRRQQAVNSLQQQIDGLVVATDVEIFYQPIEPTHEDASGGVLVEGSRWFDTDDNNHPYVFTEDDGLWHDARDQLVLNVEANLTAEQLARIGADNAQLVRLDALELTVNDPIHGVAANADAVSAHNLRITSNEGGLVAQAGRLDSLALTVFDANTGVGANASALASQALDITRIGEDIAAQGQDIASLQATVENPSDGVAASAAAIDQLQIDVSFIDGELKSQATALTQVQTESGDNTTAVQVLQQSVDGIEGQYTVKIDSNGYVAGYGLSVTQNEYDGSQHSEMIFSVDRFSVGAPGATELAFIIDGNRVVMDGALIKDATISTAQVGRIAVDRITGINAAFVLARIGTGSITNAYIGDVIQSDSFDNSGGTQGWRIHKNGSAIFNNIYARGNIEADRLKANAVNIIDTLHVKGNAITVAQAVKIGNKDLTNRNASAVLAQTSFNPEGGGYHVIVTGEFYQWDDGAVEVELFINGKRQQGNVIWQDVGGGSDMNWSVPVSMSYGGTSASSVSVRVTAKHLAHKGGKLRNANLLILGTKR